MFALQREEERGHRSIYRTSSAPLNMASALRKRKCGKAEIIQSVRRKFPRSATVTKSSSEEIACIEDDYAWIHKQTIQEAFREIEKENKRKEERNLIDNGTEAFGAAARTGESRGIGKNGKYEDGSVVILAKYGKTKRQTAKAILSVKQFNSTMMVFSLAISLTERKEWHVYELKANRAAEANERI